MQRKGEKDQERTQEVHERVTNGKKRCVNIKFHFNWIAMIMKYGQKSIWKSYFKNITSENHSWPEFP